MRIVNHLPPSGETINLVRPAEIKSKGATKAETALLMVECADMNDATSHPDMRSGAIDECSSLYQALDILSYSV
ncbi:MAG: hypothetical protein WAU05_14750 [Nitrospira sp.]